MRRGGERSCRRRKALDNSEEEATAAVGRAVVAGQGGKVAEGTRRWEEVRSGFFYSGFFLLSARVGGGERYFGDPYGTMVLEYHT